MTYVGDFPPCSHQFINSNGLIICQWCGCVSRANDSLQTRTTTGTDAIRLR